MRDLRAQPPVLVRLAQEVDDLGDLVLDLVDARHVGERGPWPVCGRYSVARERPNDPSDAARAAPAEPSADGEEQPHQQQGRPEAEQQLLPHGGPASGGLALIGTPVLCSCWNRLSFAKVGRCGREAGHSCAAPALGRCVGDGLLEAPLQRLARRSDQLDVRRAHLAEEERVGDRGPGSGDMKNAARIQLTSRSTTIKPQNRRGGGRESSRRPLVAPRRPRPATAVAARASPDLRTTSAATPPWGRHVAAGREELAAASRGSRCQGRSSRLLSSSPACPRAATDGDQGEPLVRTRAAPNADRDACRPGMGQCRYGRDRGIRGSIVAA